MMLKDALKAMVFAWRRLFRDWQVASLFGGVCSLLIIACYFFATTKEATIGQVLLTFLLALTAVLLFYMLQAMSVGYTRDHLRAEALVRRSLKNSWRLMLVTLPLVILAWLILQVTSQTGWRASSLAEKLLNIPRPRWSPSETDALQAASGAQAFDWASLLLSSLRLTFFAVALPLAAIHLWIGAAHDGVRQTLRRAVSVMARAFRPQSVLIYSIGFSVFGLVPCLLLFVRTPAGNAWVEVGLLAARLALGFAFLLFGWVATLGALAGINRTTESE